MRSRNILFLIAVFSTVLSAPAWSQARGEKVLINIDRKGVGLQGYDPVGYFTEKHPVKGSSQYAASYGGATYYFATAEHKAAFESDPERYVPRFGGYCAYGASQGHKAPVDVNAWQIQGGHLLLQYSKAVQAKFLADSVGNLEKAEANWPKLVEEEGKPLGQ